MYYFNINKALWNNSNRFWRYQKFSTREEDVHVHPPFLSSMDEMLKEETASCNNLELMKLVEKYSRWIFSVWEFSKEGGDFQWASGGNWWMRIYRVGILQRGIFLERYIKPIINIHKSKEIITRRNTGRKLQLYK